MASSLPIRRRKIASAVVFLALSTVLAGCNSQRGGQILPYLHNASYGDSGQLVTPPPANLRRHGRSPRQVQFHRRVPPI